MLRIPLTLNLFLVSCIRIWAQNTNIHYTTNNGLPTNHIYQIEQDADGFMWFATNAGIVKFDGYEFKTFTTQNGLPTNDVWRIGARPDGKVWYFAKSKRLGYIHRDTVHSFPIEGNRIPLIKVYSFSDKDVSFVASIGNILVTCFKLRNKRWDTVHTIHWPNLFKHYDSPINLPDRRMITRSEIRSTLHDRNYKPLYDFKTTPDELALIINEQKAFSKYIFFEDKQLLFSLSQGNVTVHNLVDSTVIARRIFSKKYPVSIGTIAIPEVQEYKDHFQVSQMNEWVAIDKNLRVLESRTFDIKSPPVHIYKDSRDNFWLAGHDFGLLVYPKSYTGNRYHFQGKKVQTVNILNGRLVVNVLDEGWYVREEAEERFRPIIRNVGKVYGEGYHTGLGLYYFYDNGAFWYGKNLYKLKKVSRLSINGGPTNAGAKSIIETPAGFKAANTISLIDLDSSFVMVNDDYDWYMMGINAIVDFNGTLYAAGGDGIKTLEEKRPEQSARHPLLQVPVNNMIVFGKEYLLVGTDGFGAYFYDGADKVFPIKGTEGFSVNKIIVDGNNIWMATAKGIHRFEKGPAGYRLSQSIYDKDGLLDNYVNSIYIKHNTLYVASDNGLTIIDLHPDRYSKPVRPYFLGNRFYNKTQNSVSVSYGNNVTLPFGVLCLPSQKYIQYYYKTAVSDPWQPTKTTTLVMGKQPPGEYDISLKAVDQHGNTGQTNIRFIVLPLWYQTLSAKIGALLAVILIIILITVSMRKRTENKRRKGLELSKTLSDLELKALRSQMNPHFVFNSLNAIQYFIVKNKTEFSEEYLAKFSRLVRLFFDYSKYDALKLSQEVDLLRRYLEIEKIRFEDKLEYDIVIDEAIDDEDIEVPSMILQPIVENAVNHGIFHKKGGGTVKISFKKTGDFSMLISIEDNGVGIFTMKEIQKDTYGNYKSKSSEVIRERLKILSENKNARWKIDYKITDRSQIDPSMNGTLVEIHIMFMNDKI